MEALWRIDRVAMKASIPLHEDVANLVVQYAVNESMCTNGMASAALRFDGTVMVWGDSRHGGDSSEVHHLLVNVVSITANQWAFAAILQDETVVTWGRGVSGGNSKMVRMELVGVTEIHSLESVRFGWKHIFRQNLTRNRINYASRNELLDETAAFIAITKAGEIVTWGDHLGQIILREKIMSCMHWDNNVYVRLDKSKTV